MASGPDKGLQHLYTDTLNIVIRFIVVVKKNVPIAERFFCYNTYAAILYSENYYENWYNCLLR